VRVNGLIGAAAAAAMVGLLVPATGSASEPTVHNGVGSMLAPPSASADRGDTSAGHTITFDPGTAPCTFEFAVPLGEEYADLGVHFSGPDDDTGGAILNQCGSFGVDAHSGEEFLAFSTLTFAIPPERIAFDDPQRTVSLYVANGFGDGTSTYKLKGRLDGEVVARKKITTAELGWLQIKVSAESGMDKITLTGTTPDGAFVVDDLKFRGL
jgi:hypothetical protein